MAELSIDEISDYRDYLGAHQDEWAVLDKLCQVTISRFYRDRPVCRFLAREVLPDLARQVLQQGADYLRVWSVGCGSGEEPFTISLIWRLQVHSQFPGLSLRLVATDANPVMRQHVTDACYAYSSVKDLPADWRDTAFCRDARRYCLKPEFRDGIEFMQQDVRQLNPAETFDLVLCRNLVFTYFEEDLQRSILDRMRAALKPGGALIIGIHERLPEGVVGFSEWSARLRVYRKSG
ncbi:MAG: methyltransferase domain-containing protein [Gammaproteobacteria bacterium]|nr:methyltransferase domain-containing protein [Gammaproteobacteria bacterium]